MRFRSQPIALGRRPLSNDVNCSNVKEQSTGKHNSDGTIFRVHSSAGPSEQSTNHLRVVLGYVSQYPVNPRHGIVHVTTDLKGQYYRNMSYNLRTLHRLGTGDFEISLTEM